MTKIVNDFAAIFNLLLNTATQMVTHYPINFIPIYLKHFQIVVKLMEW